VTLAISRVPDHCEDDLAGRRRFENRLARAVTAAGCPVVFLPHIYHLRPEDEAAVWLRRQRARWGLATWMYPRAARWTLAALGVRAAPPCFALWDWASPEEAAPVLIAALGAPSPGATEERVPPPRDIGQGGAARWYPVLDYDRCTGCRQCLDFCLFGVYALDGKSVVVRQPERCKPGCPACARVCPQRAILFPSCPDPDIAGRPAPRPSEAAAGERAAQSQQVVGGASDASGPHLDHLDALIDDLERLDE